MRTPVRLTYPRPCEANEAIGAWCGTIMCREQDAVWVEWMPECWRDSHVAAGLTSLATAGTFPDNGAERLTVCHACASDMLEIHGSWARTVSP